MKLMRFIFICVLGLLISGCFGTKASSILIGAGIGVGATCMFLWGNPFCQDGSAFNVQANNKSTTPLWMIHDPYFPDASVPYDMY